MILEQTKYLLCPGFNLHQGIPVIVENIIQLLITLLGSPGLRLELALEMLHPVGDARPAIPVIRQRTNHLVMPPLILLPAISIMLLEP